MEIVGPWMIIMYFIYCIGYNTFALLSMEWLIHFPEGIVSPSPRVDTTYVKLRYPRLEEVMKNITKDSTYLQL